MYNRFLHRRDEWIHSSKSYKAIATAVSSVVRCWFPKSTRKCNTMIQVTWLSATPKLLLIEEDITNNHRKTLELETHCIIATPSKQNASYINKKAVFPARHSCLPLRRWVFHSAAFNYSSEQWWLIIPNDASQPQERLQTKQTKSNPHQTWTAQKKKQQKKNNKHQNQGIIRSHLNPSQLISKRLHLRCFSLTPGARLSLRLLPGKGHAWVWLKSRKKWWLLMMFDDFWYLPKQNSWIWGVFFEASPLHMPENWTWRDSSNLGNLDFEF